MEETVQKLQATLGCHKSDDPIAKIRELEEENYRLRQEIELMRAQMCGVYSSPSNASPPTMYNSRRESSPMSASVLSLASDEGDNLDRDTKKRKLSEDERDLILASASVP